MPQDNRSAMRKTIVARIATFDTSIPNPTEEQVTETLRLLVLALELYKGQPDGAVLQSMHDKLTEVKNTQRGAESPVAPQATPGEPIPPDVAQEGDEAPEGGSTETDEDNSVVPPDPASSTDGAQSAGTTQDAAKVMGTKKSLSEKAEPEKKDNPRWMARMARWQEDKELSTTLEPILDALALVESRNNPDAVGDKGRAVGLFQAWPIAVAEANRVSGREKTPIWTKEDRKDPAQARAMAKATLLFHYNRGVTDPVELGGKWRDPYGNVLQKEIENNTRGDGGDYPQLEYKQELRKQLNELKKK